MKKLLYLAILAAPSLALAKTQTSRCVEEVRLNSMGDVANPRDVILVSSYDLPVKDNCRVAIDSALEPTEMEKLKPVRMTIPATPTQSIEFPTSSYSIPINAKKDLEQLALQLRTDAPVSITVSGFADKTGSEKFNQKLSELRAEAVQKVLAKKGIPTDRIKIEAFGSEPFNASRRVDIKVSNF